jgi:alpha-L-fucosidase
MVWDIERSQSNTIVPFTWQTDTCMGQWHYDRGVYDLKEYKTAQTIIHTLIGVVNKNGNLMLNIPLCDDGSIDKQEHRVVEDIGVWMRANSDSIYETRPWKIFGEGPVQEDATAQSAQGFNKGKGKPFSDKDVRFAIKRQLSFCNDYLVAENWTGTFKELTFGECLPHL